MRALNIFLLGRPGCGKSEIYRRITGKFESDNICNDFIRIDDFPKLWAIFQEAEKTGVWTRCRKTEDKGYKVIDNNVWDDILKEVNADVMALQHPDRVVFIEFSRPNYMESLRNFSKEILDNAVVVYVECPFALCWERNVARHKAALDAGSDDHLVSREEMEKTYLNDDSAELLKSPALPVLVVDTNEPGTDHLVPKIARVMTAIKNIIDSRGNE